MDYLVPTASEAPEIDIAHIVSPSPLTPLGSKGLGESSSMTVPAVIANAVSDALAPLGIRINDLPMTPSKLWQTMDRAKRSQARGQDRATVDRADRSHAAPEAGHPRSKPASRTPLQ
jgi:hypothetical protein